MLGRNCRMDRFEYKQVTAGLDWDSPLMTEELSRKMKKEIPELCGVVFNEPGWTCRTKSHFGSGMEVKQHLNSSFWDAYTTILLYRDPWERYLSHLSEWQVVDGNHPATVEEVLGTDGVFGDYKIDILKRNFITQVDFTC